MMDFEDAAKRLQRDQQKLRGRKTVTVSAKAKREAELRKQQAIMLRESKKRQFETMQKYITACDRGLGVKSLVVASGGSSTPTPTPTASLQLQATSIHGEGDKLALPPSVLEYLTRTQLLQSDNDVATSSPWMFRIGILDPEYRFPQSALLQALKENEEDHDDDDDDMSDDDGHETSQHASSNNNSNKKAAYLDELSHKYISYTHGTVVEFTQDEGHVGLPAPIAKALMDQNRRRVQRAEFGIPSKRTQDPSLVNSSMDATQDDTMATPADHSMDNNDEEDTEKTPGHVAYGAFDVPDMPVEITMVRLPKGKGCTLQPTHDAISNGFYSLKDIKLVLEQSLIRTRATLTVGDVVTTWHRGVRYDLTVTKVVPATYHAVTCINTDIEVEFDQVEPDQTNKQMPATTTTTGFSSTGQTLSGGRTLTSSPILRKEEASTVSSQATIDLIPEPPGDQIERVCTVQIRGDGVSHSAAARRRFDVQKATLKDLFDFARTVMDNGGGPLIDVASFRLVTRFPRKVYQSGIETMAQAGIEPGQELFLIEKV